MLPIQIEVTNFSSYKHEIIDFTKFSQTSPTLIEGANGAGKSSIIDMITTAIFNQCHGTDSRGSGMEDLIHQGADSFKIDYTFSMNNYVYKIIREKTKKGQTLKFFINGEDHTSKLQETQNKINNIFKMDYETFMDTVIMGQNESAGFMKKSPLERKKIIAQILRLDKYDILENYTKDTKKKLENDIKLLENSLNNLYDSIINKDNFSIELIGLKSEILTLQENIAKKEKELEIELIEKTKYEELKKQQDSIINRKKNIANSLANIETEKIKYEELKIKIEDVLKDRSITENKIQNLNENNSKLLSKEKEFNSKETTLITENNMINNNINEAKNKFIQLKKYDSCDCKFCGQQITPEHKLNHLKELKNQGITLQNQYNKNNDNIEKIKSELIKIQTQLATNNNELTRLTTYFNKIQQAEVKIESVNSKLTDLEVRKTELIEEEKEVNNINIDILENKTFNDFSIKMELQNLRQNLTSKNSRITILENQLSNIEKNEKDYAKSKKEFDTIKEQIEIYNDLQKSWGKNGIQAIIIDNILPQIEDEINKYLKILSGDNISITFKTQKEAKNGNKSETLDIIVKDSKGERPYERYSGGEKTRINFACHIGMSKFLTRRSGANIDFFIVDEGIGTLDETGKDDFIDTIKSLNLIFKQVMVISHIPDIKEAFDNKVLITKDIFEGSKVNIIS